MTVQSVTSSIRNADTMLPSNGNAFRFSSKKHKEDVRRASEFRKEYTVEVPRTCRVCGQEPATGYTKLKVVKGKTTCTHVRPTRYEDPHLTQGESKRIADKLSANEVAVKGDDGIIRIIDKNATE